MKLELDTPAAALKIERYAAGSIVIRGTAYTHSIVITPEGGILHWPPRHFSEISTAHMEAIAAGGAKILLLGTGSRQHFLTTPLFEPLYSRNIGYEIMDTGAACRSFNILAGDGREGVCAALLIEDPAPGKV